MLTEARVRRVVDSLPQKSFVRKFVDFASESTDAHVIYHVAGALAILTQTCPQELEFNFGAGLKPNLYTIIVGPSSRSRKTVAANIAQKILREALPAAVGEPPGSTEGLIDSLRDSPRQLLYYEEFGDFLAKTQFGYLQPLKPQLTGLYDCSPIGRATVKSKRGRIENPRLSLLAACAPGFLEKHTEPTDWTEGFMARFLTLEASRERLFTRPMQNKDRRSLLVATVKDMMRIERMAGQSLGFDDESGGIWDEWVWQMDESASHGTSHSTQAAMARAPAMALKIATLLSWDCGPAADGGPWYLTMQELGPAIEIAQMHAECVRNIGETLATTQDMRDRRAVLTSIELTPTSLGSIITRSHLLKHRVVRILDSLMTEGAIVRCASSGTAGDYFQRTDVVTGLGMPSSASVPVLGSEDDGPKAVVLQ